MFIGFIVGFILVLKFPFGAAGHVLLAIISLFGAAWAAWRAASIKTQTFSLQRAIMVAVVVIFVVEIGLQVYSMSPHIPS
jgi:hypothetical protein